MNHRSESQLTERQRRSSEEPMSDEHRRRVWYACPKCSYRRWFPTIAEATEAKYEHQASEHPSSVMAGRP